MGKVGKWHSRNTEGTYCPRIRVGSILCAVLPQPSHTGQVAPEGVALFYFSELSPLCHVSNWDPYICPLVESLDWKGQPSSPHPITHRLPSDTPAQLWDVQPVLGSLWMPADDDLIRGKLAKTPGSDFGIILNWGVASDLKCCLRLTFRLNIREHSVSLAPTLG